MPWDYKTDKPDAVKYLHPKIAKKAIKIANAIVENGGDEGMAIATGIKRAKGLVKLAVSSHNPIVKKIIKAFKKNDKDYLADKYNEIIDKLKKDKK